MAHTEDITLVQAISGNDCGMLVFDGYRADSMESILVKRKLGCLWECQYWFGG